MITGFVPEYVYRPPNPASLVPELIYRTKPRDRCIRSGFTVSDGIRSARDLLTLDNPAENLSRRLQTRAASFLMSRARAEDASPAHRSLAMKNSISTSCNVLITSDNVWSPAGLRELSDRAKD